MPEDPRRPGETGAAGEQSRTRAGGAGVPPGAPRPARTDRNAEPAPAGLGPPPDRDAQPEPAGLGPPPGAAGEVRSTRVPAAVSRVPAADGTERVVLQGLAALRWAAWTWMAAVAALSRGNLARPGLAAVLVGAALAGTAAGTALLRRRPAALLRPAAVGAELAVGLALVLGDGWTRVAGLVFSTSQSLG